MAVSGRHPAKSLPEGPSYDPPTLDTVPRRTRVVLPPPMADGARFGTGPPQTPHIRLITIHLRPDRARRRSLARAVRSDAARTLGACNSHLSGGVRMLRRLTLAAASIFLALQLLGA